MYSENFEKAFKYVINNEGGYSHNPHDKGGETKYGITKASYPKVDIKNLTLDEAKKIYYCDFWTKGKCEKVQDAAIAAKIFDLCINMGINTAIKVVQRALRSTGQNVVEDGIAGPATLSAINRADATDLLAALKSEAAGYYRLIAQNKPTQRQFLTGWLNRAYRDIDA